MMKMFPNFSDLFADTHPNTGYGCIDHILITPSIKVHQKFVETFGRPRLEISDHFGLFSQFSIEKKE